MSTPAKTTVLRAILADDASVKIVTVLGTPGKTEARRVPLVSGQLTTEQIVGRIKELSKLREEILQAIRQLNLTRESGPGPVDRPDYESELEAVRRELEEIRNQYQELQGRVENIQRQIDDSRKRIASLMKMSQTGFATDELDSEGNFRRVLGQLPAKKLEAAQRAMQSQFKEQAIVAVGNKNQDAIYVLVAAPKDKSSQALQTLLLYDFTPIEIPDYMSGDAKSEIQAEEARVELAATELDTSKLHRDELRNKAGLTLNRRLDQTIAALILLRGVLKLGEGTQASQVYAHLQRAIPSETMNNLARRGIIELESSS